MFKSLCKGKKIILFLLDALIIMVSYLSTYYFIGSFGIKSYFINSAIAIVAYGVMLYIFGVYNQIIRYSSIREYLRCLISSIICCFILSLATLLSTNFLLKIKFHIFAGIISTVGFIALRVFIRSNFNILKNIFTKNKTEDIKKVLIIGAGSAANTVIQEIKNFHYNEYKIEGIIDDDEKKQGFTLSGIKILGNRKKILSVCKDKKIDVIFFTISSISGEDKKNILDLCHQTGKKVKVLPSINDFIVGKSVFKNMRNIEVTDLLSRDPVDLDDGAIKEYITNKVVMVTGGGGSIGSELCRQIAKFSPKHLIVLDIYENNAYDIEYELKTHYPDLKKSIVIASVRDKERIEQVFDKYHPEIVFHAAAHKHVPLMESNAGESIKNNVFGTLNVAECADKFKVEKFILISTDKAVNPTNIMGASKRICEMIIQSIDKKSETDYVAVRFGNVLGSNGSVIPLFKKQISEGGPVTVTHKEIIRYFMTIPEAAQLVLQAGTFAEGGEIFVLDMGKPVRIYDLAVNMIKLSGLVPDKDIKIEISGLRPGEKLYEELLMSEEGLTNTANKKIFIAKPMSIDFYQLKVKINDLLSIVKNPEYDLDYFKNKLSEVVPTYIIDNNKVNNIQKSEIEEQKCACGDEKIPLKNNI